MHGAGLAVEDKEVFAAIAGLDFVGDPEFDEADAIEVSETKIEDEGGDDRKSDIPGIELGAATGDGFVGPGTFEGDIEAFIEFLHGGMRRGSWFGGCAAAVLLYFTRNRDNRQPLCETEKMPTREEIASHLRENRGIIDVHSHVGMNPVALYDNSYPYCMSAEDQAVRARLLGVDYTVVFPFLYTSYFDLKAFARGEFVHDPDGASLPYEVENRRLLEEIYEVFPRYGRQLLPFAFFDPGREVQAQAEYVAELAAKWPVFGLKTASSYLQSHVTDLLKDGQPLLELAARLDVPFMLHTAVMPGDPWGNVFALLEVEKARPDVRFCLAHTCRFDRRALDAAAELPNCWVDFSAFNIHAQLAVQGHEAIAPAEHRFPADYADHAGAMGAIAEAYPELMLWGSDTPYHYFMAHFHDASGKRITMHLACDCETETDELRKLPPATIERITCTNTLRYLFGPGEA